MKLYDLVRANRSFRGYDRSVKVTREQLEELVELARLCPSSINMQPLKFFLSCEDETTAKIQSLTNWAGKLRGKIDLPHPGKEPTAFIVICLDKTIVPQLGGWAKDVGIVAQTMLLGACEMGLGGCMIGSYDGKKLAEALGLGDSLEPELVVAIGKPDEAVTLTDVGADGVTDYSRDGNDVHYVPKRSRDELIINK